VVAVNLDRAIDAYAAARARVEEVKKENAERLRAARQRVEETRAALADAIAEAYLNGARVGELASRTGYNRETIRLILRNHGIPAE